MNKGGFYSGLSFNFNTKNTQDKDVAVYVIKNRNDDNVNINLDQGYFIKDNFALGALINFSYKNREGIQSNTDDEVTHISVVFSSGAQGIKYEGGVNSTLIVNNFKLIH